MQTLEGTLTSGTLSAEASSTMSALKESDANSFARSIVVVPMRRRHLARVMEIERQVYQNPWSRGVFESELSQGPTRMYVIASKGRDMVGYCGTLYVLDEAHVTNIAVHPEWQNMGIGTRLLCEVVWRAWKRDIRAITLEVRVSNLTAQRLYGKFGFQPVGVRKGYYQENNEDALIMWAYDIDSPEYHERILNIEAQAGISGGAGRRLRIQWR